MTDELKPEPQYVTLLYIGATDGEGKTPLWHLWYDLTDLANDGSPLVEDRTRYHHYGTGKRKHSGNITYASPGQIYTFQKSEKGVFGSTAQYQGRWECEADRMQWQIESRAIERSVELRQRAKKESKERLDWAALDPFRDAYHGNKLNYIAQELLLAQVLRYITDYTAWRRAKGKEPLP